LLGSELVEDLGVQGGGSGGVGGGSVGRLLEVAVPLAGHLDGKTVAAVLRTHDGLIGRIAKGRGREFGGGSGGVGSGGVGSGVAGSGVAGSGSGGISGKFFFQDDARQYALLYTGKFSGHAIAVQKYRLTVAAGRNGIVLGTPSGQYYEDDPVSLTAVPSAGYRFAGWTVRAAGGIRVSEKAGASTFAMPAGDVEIRASFEPVRSAGASVSPGGGPGTGFGVKLPALSKLKITKVKVGKRKLSVAWKKAPAAQKVRGYQVSHRVFKVVKKKVGKRLVNRIRAGKWKAKSVSASKKSYVIKKLKKGQRYQVRVRSWRVVTGQKAYGKWRTVKRSGKVR
jgi:hypothetical protein